MNEPKLRYSDERDKTYGIAGMTITLVALDGYDLLAEIHLDSEPGESMVMSHDFGLRGNPRMSAKIVWEQMLRELRMTTSMALGNLACRRYVLAHTGMTKAETDGIRKAVVEEGREYCALDEDECGSLFDGCYRYVDRIFRHAAIGGVVDAFADELTRRRSMSVSEAVELLAHLGLR